MVELYNVNIGEEELQKIVSVCHDFKGKPSLSKLWEMKHFSIFEYVQFIFYIETEIFVARQLFRYRTATPTEKSLRYTKPTVTTPKTFGGIDFIEQLYADINTSYEKLIELGYNKEDARMIVPLSTETKFFFRIDMRNLYHLLEERLDKHTQKETRKIAEQMLCNLPEWVKNIYKL